MAQAALIDPGAIRKAIAQYPDALIERRLDHGMAMVVARRGKQQRLGIRAAKFAYSRQHQMPDDLGAGRSAGLAGDDGAPLGGLETLRERLDLGGFARALAALEGDEAPAAGRSFACCLAHPLELLDARPEHPDHEFADAVDRPAHGRA